MTQFPPFRLDSLTQCLWRTADGGHDERILLTPKAFAVLRYLIERPLRQVSLKCRWRWEFDPCTHGCPNDFSRRH
jgi:DNA-binding response OmpR family regulator